jgi:hypothetical protein
MTPKKKGGGGTVVYWAGWAEIAKKWAKNGPTIGALQKTFFFGTKFGIFLSHHILLPIVDLKNIWRGAAQWSNGWK